jgi:fructokinase
MKLGLPTSFLGSIGDDQYGRYIQKDFKHEGINTDNLIIEKDLNTVGVFAFIDEFGERYLWGWPRENQAFKEINLNKIDLQTIKSSSWVHTSGMAMVYNTSARYAIIKILKVAHEAGIPTSLDINLRVKNGNLNENYKKSVLKAMQYSAYVLGSGPEEFYYLNPEKNWLESAGMLANPDRIIIARLGEEGSVGITPEETIKTKAFKVNVVDTVGAGDVYNAGFIFGRLNNKSLRECLQTGNAVSGYSVMHQGSRHTPNRKELETFLSEHPNEPSDTKGEEK